MVLSRTSPNASIQSHFLVAWKYTEEICKMSWVVPRLPFPSYLLPNEFLPLALISLCICKRYAVTWALLLYARLGNPSHLGDLLISSVCYCTVLASSKFRTANLWCPFQPLNVETMTEILDQSIPWAARQHCSVMLYRNGGQSPTAKAQAKNPS